MYFDSKPEINAVNWETGKVEGHCQFCQREDITSEMVSPIDIKISCQTHGNIGFVTRKRANGIQT